VLRGERRKGREKVKKMNEKKDKKKRNKSKQLLRENSFIWFLMSCDDNHFTTFIFHFSLSLSLSLSLSRPFPERKGNFKVYEKLNKRFLFQVIIKIKK
jgi:hypothetical protein